MSAQDVVSWGVMAYRKTMHTPHPNRRSFAYRAGYAIGAATARLIIWPVMSLLHAGDSE